MAMEIERIGAGRPGDNGLAAWAAALQASADNAGQAVRDTLGELLQGIHGSDVRLPDEASSAPGASGSAAPEAADLSGEITRRSPQALSLQRSAVASLQTSSSGWAAAAPQEALLDHPLSHAAPSAAGASTPTQATASPGETTATVTNGDVHDGQAGDTLGTSIFNAAAARR